MAICTSDINHEIKINAAPQVVYRALTNASELTKWHTSRTENANGKDETFTTYPKDGPAFEWKVLKPDSHTVEWQCVAGPGDSVGTIARFTVSPLSDGRTLVEFSHRGWPDTSGNFRKCNTLWAVLLFHLQKYLSTKQPGPAFS
jgi:uncharacterized protein YndB with AHSA1/START domain